MGRLARLITIAAILLSGAALAPYVGLSYAKFDVQRFLLAYVPTAAPRGGCTVYSSDDIPKAIPDTDPAGVSSIILVPAVVGFNLTGNIGVRLDRIDHPVTGQLRVSLVSPNNITVTVANQVGGASANFYQTVMYDTASLDLTSGNAPFTGSFRPSELLSRLAGSAPHGIWRLHIADLVEYDTGTLYGWSVEVCRVRVNLPYIRK